MDLSCQYSVVLSLFMYNYKHSLHDKHILIICVMHACYTVDFMVEWTHKQINFCYINKY